MSTDKAVFPLRPVSGTRKPKSLNKVFAETRAYHERMNLIVGDYNGILYHTLILEAFRKGGAQDAYEKMPEHIDVTMRQFRHDSGGAAAEVA